MGFMPLSHVPMIFGIVAALSSLAFLPYGAAIVLSIVGGGVALFLIGFAIGFVKLLMRSDLEWQQALGIDQ